MSDLRRIMAEPSTLGRRLNNISQHLSIDLHVNICTIFVMKSNGVLLDAVSFRKDSPETTYPDDLFATIFAHIILISEESLALADLTKFPNQKIAEIRQKPINGSLLAVPILRGGAVLGGIILQGDTGRRFVDSEVEVLQTVATLLGEMFTPNNLQLVIDDRESKPVYVAPVPNAPTLVKFGELSG